MTYQVTVISGNRTAPKLMASPPRQRSSSVEKITDDADLKARHNDCNGSRILKSIRGRKVPKANHDVLEGSVGEDQGDEDADDDDGGKIDADDVEEDDDDEAEVEAPSHGASTAVQMGSLAKEDSTSKHSSVKQMNNPHGTGPSSSDNFSRVTSLKRRHSNLSNSSLIMDDGDHDNSSIIFPRKKQFRTLSNENGMLTYSTISADITTTAVPENAVEDSDEDDELYQAVNLISDGEEDDPDVEKVEEELIMRTGTPLDSTDATDATGLFSFEDARNYIPNGVYDMEISHLEDILGMSDRNFASHLASQNVSFDGRKYSDSSAKRVRFAIDGDSDSSASSTDIDGMFPDIFADQESLPPMLQQLIENDTDGGDSITDGEGSYWDFSEYDGQSQLKGIEGDADEGESTDISSSDCRHHHKLFHIRY
jgi:hypothetical protein